MKRGTDNYLSVSFPISKQNLTNIYARITHSTAHKIAKIVGITTTINMAIDR